MSVGRGSWEMPAVTSEYVQCVCRVASGYKTVTTEHRVMALH